MNLNLLSVSEEKVKEDKKEKNEKLGNMSKNHNKNSISLVFPDSYDIKKYFASPMERLKNMYLLNCDRKKIILPKIKM